MVAKTLSELDGYIYYLGFEPGKYVARVDTGQLNNLNFTADPPQIDFTIKTIEEGDIVAGIDFVLTDNNIKEKPIEKPIVPIEKAIVSNEKTFVPIEKEIVPNEKTFIPIEKGIVPNEKGMI